MENMHQKLVDFHLHLLTAQEQVFLPPFLLVNLSPFEAIYLQTIFTFQKMQLSNVICRRNPHILFVKPPFTAIYPYERYHLGNEFQIHPVGEIV